MHRTLLATLLLTALLSAPAAYAQDGDAGDSSEASSTAASTPDTSPRLGTMVIGFGIGPNIQGAFSPLKLFVHPRFELGANLPFLGQRFSVAAMAAYTRPPASSVVSDNRLPDSGQFSFDLVQHELMFGLGIHIRFLELAVTQASPYVGGGPQIFLLRTQVVGQAAGQEFGENREQQSKAGAYAVLGVEIKLGPGALFVQGVFSWSKLDKLITGDSNTGSITPSVGYRLMVL